MFLYFVQTEGEEQTPRTLLVAGGGGGLSWSNTLVTDENNGGQSINTSIVSPTVAALLTNISGDSSAPGKPGHRPPAFGNNHFVSDY